MKRSQYKLQKHISVHSAAQVYMVFTAFGIISQTHYFLLHFKG